MDNKFNNMLKEFMENTDAENMNELDAKLQEFIEQYNNGEIEYENTALDDAYDLLEQAANAKNEKQALKLAKKAYDMCPECLDALLFQVQLEENAIKRMKLLNEGLEKEKNRLKAEKYFDKDNIGHFYGIFETRPYIRALYFKTLFLFAEGKLKQARDVCKEILKLNENDNTGARYLLMAIYACLEEDKELLSLYKKYEEECLEMLFPLFVLYYKKGDDKKANQYLKRIHKANPHFIKFFKGTMEENDDVPLGCYAKGDSSEVVMYFMQYDYLMMTAPFIDEYILDNLKE